MQKLLALSASAGSGKTFNLVAKYLSLLFLGEKPSDILAVTFTNKAANEMKQRIITSLRDLDDVLIDLIISFNRLPKEEIKKKRPFVLERFLKSPVHIITIDKFINQILRKFSFYLGVAYDFEIESGSNEAIFEHFLKELDEKTYKKVVEFARFENKKSGSLVELFDLFYDKEKEIPSLSFASYDTATYEKEVMKYALLIKSYILDTEASKQAKGTVNYETIEGVLNASWLKKESFNYWHFKKVYHESLDQWLNELKKVIRLYYMHKEAYILDTLFTLYKAYRETKLTYKQKLNSYGFKDIENFVYELLHGHILSEFIYFRLDSRINHILIDEFQDTSVTQFSIFEPLISEIVSSGNAKSFFYVGDTKQSIYRFRGGQKALFDSVISRYGVTLKHLNTNYRSKEEIVEFVNRTFDYVKPKQIAQKKGGYVEIVEGDVLENLEKTLMHLFEKGIDENALAVIVYSNNEILKVESFIQETFQKEVITTTKAKVKNQPSAKAVIHLLFYIYYTYKKERAEIHKLNFLSLTGKPYEEVFDHGIKLDTPAEMIKAAIKRYDLFDDASIRLMLHSLSYHNLAEFVLGIESYDEEMPGVKLKGIKVLTIHKSKGLEFENLIVCDRFSRPPSNTDSLLFSYDDTTLEGIHVKFKQREYVDPHFAEVLQKEKDLIKEDKTNVEYVAFTRAKNALFILKKEKSSEFDNLSLSPTSYGKLEIERHEKVKENRPRYSIEKKHFGKQSVQKKEKTFTPDDFEAIYFGLAVHYLFETESFDATHNLFGEYCDTQKAYTLYEKASQNEAYLSLIKEGRKYKELPFVYEGDQGVMDLLIEKESEIVIVDYKSSTPSDFSAYASQIDRYKKAAHTLFKKKPIAYLYLLDTLTLKRM